jgi:UDP-N-acetylmuramoyl-tripeptide--D-alanyl-D-alanine ligase
LIPFTWTAREVCRALHCEARAGDEQLRFGAISTDTRSLQPGSLFVAIEGDRFDAHEFLEEAAVAGAAGAVVRRLPEGAPERLRYFRVADTLRALGDLAHYRRRLLDARVVGVAGSNGKTTTKDLLRAALGSRYRVHATEGNLNNLVGLPLSLLAAPAEAEVVVLELGTDQPGEIERLTQIAEPHFGVITAIGEEHLEKLGSVAGVLEEEIQLVAGLHGEAVGFVAEEPAELPHRARQLLGPERVRVAGFGESADLRPDGGAAAIRVEPDGATRWAWRGHALHLSLPGRHQVRNALLALGVAVELGVDAGEAVRGIERMPAPKLRGEWHRIGDLRVLADCYNANPPSLSAAVELLAALPANGAKLAVVGTMREMGAESDALHRRAAEAIGQRVGRGIDRVVATGAFVPAFEPLAASLGPALVRCEDPVEAYQAVAASLTGSETILLKASRGEELERWLPLLQRDWGGEPRRSKDE